jgi:hypothetical protein
MSLLLSQMTAALSLIEKKCQSSFRASCSREPEPESVPRVAKVDRRLSYRSAFPTPSQHSMPPSRWPPTRLVTLIYKHDVSLSSRRLWEELWVKRHAPKCTSGKRPHPVPLSRRRLTCREQRAQCGNEVELWWEECDFARRELGEGVHGMEPSHRDDFLPVIGGWRTFNFILRPYGKLWRQQGGIEGDEELSAEPSVRFWGYSIPTCKGMKITSRLLPVLPIG